jgi:hypothetical protein
LINEDDCEISLPCSVEDRYIQAHGIYRSQNTSAPFSGFLAVIQITRLHTQLYQALKSSNISTETLQSFDGQFRAKTLLLPDAYRVGSDAALDVMALHPLFVLLSAQFHLHRCNITLACRPAERHEALSRCVGIGQDTAKYISRTLHSPVRSESERSWQTRVASIASNVLCMHLWRCILALCFRGDYDAALMCTHLSSAIGNAREVNMACARNAIFFLDRMLERVRTGRGSSQQLERDEEMLAYVSGHAQGSLEHSWVRAGAEVTTSNSSQRSRAHSTDARSPDEAMRDAILLRFSGASKEHVTHSRDEWARVEHLIRQLVDETRPRNAPPSSYYPPPHNPVKRVQLAPETTLSPRPVPTPSPAPSSTSRISIANII